MLDMRTIIVSNVITDIVSLIVMALLWRQTRKRFAGTGFFALDFVLQTTAFFLIILRGSIPDWLSIVLANTLVIAGAILGYMGLLRFVGKKSTQIHNYFLLVVFAFIHVYFTFWQSNLAARNANVAMGLLIICFQCAWLLLYRVETTMRQLTRDVGIVFCFYCLLSAIRIAEMFFHKHSTTDFFQSGGFDQFILTSHQMLLMLLTFSLVLMFNKRLFTDVKQQEEKFSKAFQSSPYAITITRMSDGQIIEVNDAFFNITGYQLADIQGKTTIGMHLWCREEDRALVVSELASKGKVHDSEFQFRKKAGETITGLFSAEIITINNEKCVLSSINDITERKLAEEALKESERQYRNLFENSPEGIFQSTTEGRLISANIALAKMFGYESSEEIIGAALNIDLQLYANPEERKKAVNILRETGYLKGFECQMCRKDGTTFWAVINAQFNEKQEGISCLEGFIIDINDRKQVEADILILNAELENMVAKRTNELRDSQLALLNIVEDLDASSRKLTRVNLELDVTNKELESFSYSVSHDLRAPLRGIDGFSQALLEDYSDKLDTTGKNYLERIRAGTQRMGLLIDDMLKLSRVTRAEFKRESVDLSKMVSEIILMVRQNNPARDVKVIIQKDIVVDGDSHLLEIAMTNLIDNAWKFTGKTKNASIEFGTERTDGKPVMFIRDNGVGFDMTYVDKLFGVFQRLHKADEFVGTGIGLATVKRIIIRHGGEIWAEGEVEKGATFFFTLS